MMRGDEEEEEYRMWEELPDELWEEIFGYLAMEHRRRLAPVSLVCKRFLAVSNGAHALLALPTLTSSPAALISRFRRIKTIRISFDEHIDSSITKIAQSHLPLQSLHISNQPHFPRDAMRLLGRRMRRTLRSLSCTVFRIMTDDDLSALADSFPYLEELDIEDSGYINHPLSETPQITDQGILAISLKLNSLLSLNVCSQKHISLRSFEYLSSNCPLISDLHACYSKKCPIGLHNILPFESLTSLQL